MENPIKVDDLGGKPTIFGNIHILYHKNIKRKTEKSGKNTHHYCTFHLKEKTEKKTKQTSLSLSLACLRSHHARTGQELSFGEIQNGGIDWLEGVLPSGKLT